MPSLDEVREWLKKNALSDEECHAIQERVSKYHDVNQPQPPPREATTRDCWELVIHDMKDRRAMGIHNYGMPLRAFNGREPLVDAYQELLDLCVYMRQAIEEKRILSSSTSLARTEDPVPQTQPPPEAQPGC